MNLDNLRDVFIEQLKDAYSAEKQLTETLPVLAESASSPELKQVFEQHLRITHQHVDTVRELLNRMGENPGNTKCEGMEGLVEEARDMASKKGDSDALDAGIIGAAQKAEHYEIATYGTLHTWALVLGEEDAAQILQHVLDQEYEADSLLNQLAKTYINEQAQ